MDLPLDAHGDAHAAADAQRRQALLGVALLHLVQQRDQHARAGGADRVADGDRAAVHVHLARCPSPGPCSPRSACAANASLASTRSRSSAFQPARASALRRGRDRPGAHHRRIDAGGGEGGDARQRRQAALRRFASRSSAPAPRRRR